MGKCLGSCPALAAWIGRLAARTCWLAVQGEGGAFSAGLSARQPSCSRWERPALSCTRSVMTVPRKLRERFWASGSHFCLEPENVLAKKADLHEHFKLRGAPNAGGFQLPPARLPAGLQRAVAVVTAHGAQGCAP